MAGMSAAGCGVLVGPLHAPAQAARSRSAATVNRAAKRGGVMSTSVAGPTLPRAAPARKWVPPARYNQAMARYTLVYGVRLIPEGSLKELGDAKLELADGTTAGLTLHTIDGTIPQLRRALD